LRIEEYDRAAWLGIVPFQMRGVAPRLLPDVPGMSAFPELNVRTYVEHGGKPGVWFLSLDATNALAVFAARRWFDLPYHRASIEVTTNENAAFHYRLQRRGSDVAFEGTYRPISEPRHASPGSLEHFLTERYCLYARGRAGLTRIDVHHAPWPLQDATATVQVNTMLSRYAFDLDGASPRLHFARRVDAVIWSRVKLQDSGLTSPTQAG
jgi:uncharacterized protein